MAIPSSIQGPERKVRDAVSALSTASSEVDAARVNDKSEKQERIKKAETDFKSAASALKSAAGALKDAAGRL